VLSVGDGIARVRPVDHNVLVCWCPSSCRIQLASPCFSHQTTLPVPL
jgi:hypothetical protein